LAEISNAIQEAEEELMFGTLIAVDIIVDEDMTQHYLEASKDFPGPKRRPAYATHGSAAVDLCAQDDYMLRPGECAPIRTGIRIHIQEPGYAAFVLPRSGLGAKSGIVLGNSTGLVDNDYQGPVTCFLWNRGIVDFEQSVINERRQIAHKPFHVKKGMRIAQMMFVPFVMADFRTVAQFSENTARGQGGFGSTGV
jgi:dUTP pyrophosphatase